MARSSKKDSRPKGVLTMRSIKSERIRSTT
jgi:hypothetical protein